MFFFSSRRRHTRSTRDWSSDVCSSDLARLTRPLNRLLAQRVGELPEIIVQQQRKIFFDLGIPAIIAGWRVGHGQVIDEVARLVSFRRELRIVEGADREPVAADGGHKNGALA